ncbi:hypothetical protein Hanom_Chr01g00023621 [Helianthus anomalus]
MAGLEFQEHTPWTPYQDMPVPPGPSNQSPHWPEEVGSSFFPPQFQAPTKGERGHLDSFNEIMSALTGYPYQPYPRVDPNERYQRPYGVCFLFLLYIFLRFS